MGVSGACMIHTASAEIADAETEQQRTAHKAIQVTVDTALKTGIQMPAESISVCVLYVISPFRFMECRRKTVQEKDQF